MQHEFHVFPALRFHLDDVRPIALRSAMERRGARPEVLVVNELVHPFRGVRDPRPHLALGFVHTVGFRLLDCRLETARAVTGLCSVLVVGRGSQPATDRGELTVFTFRS